MDTVELLTSRGTAIRSDILFLKKEIHFLLKILGNCYSASIMPERLKLLDDYWKDFEQEEHKLDNLYENMEKEELRLADLYLEGLIHTKTVQEKQTQLQSIFHEYSEEVKTLKESFYNFMQGCAACALKTA